MRKQLKCITGKRGFVDEKVAHKELSALRRRNENNPDRVLPVRIFWCEACNHWHMTHLEKDEFRSKGAEITDNVKPNQIANRLRKLKNKLNKKKNMKDKNEFYLPMTDISKIEILQLYAQGELSYLEISRQLALDPTQVKQVIIEHSKGYN